MAEVYLKRWIDKASGEPRAQVLSDDAPAKTRPLVDYLLDLRRLLGEEADALTQELNLNPPTGYDIDNPTSPGYDVMELGNSVLGKLDSINRDIEIRLKDLTRNEVFFIDCTGNPPDIQKAILAVKGRMKRSVKSCGAFALKNGGEFLEIGPFMTGSVAAIHLRNPEQGSSLSQPIGLGGADPKKAIAFVKRHYSSFNPLLVLVGDGQIPDVGLFDEVFCP